MTVDQAEAAAPGAEYVRVVVRCRPLNRAEASEGRQRIFSMHADMQQVMSHHRAAMEAIVWRVKHNIWLQLDQHSS